jgi:hypothetical protein
MGNKFFIMTITVMNKIILKIKNLATKHFANFQIIISLKIKIDIRILFLLLSKTNPLKIQVLKNNKIYKNLIN